LPASFFLLFFNLGKGKKEAWKSWMTGEGAGVMLSVSALPGELQAQSRDVGGNAGLRSLALHRRPCVLRASCSPSSSSPL